MCIIDTEYVRKELQAQLEQWKERQEEMEANFRRLYKPVQPSKKSKGRKSKQGADTNKELSCFAGSLTKEFFIKVRFIALYYFDTFFDWYILVLHCFSYN